MVFFFGAFNIDLMASSESAHCIPATAPGAGNKSPCFTRYASDRSAGVDFFAQDVSRVPGETARAFDFGFPPTALANTIVQHLAEQRAHAVVFTSLRSGFVGAAHGDRLKAVCYNRFPRRKKRIICRA